MAIKFIKFHSLNWIYAGKVKYKIEYTNIRKKLVSMIQNPDRFENL